MNRRRQIVRHQQQRMRQHATNSNAHAFFKLLTNPELLRGIESSIPKHRQRLFPPTETLSMFFWAQAMSADRSCQNAVNDLSIKRSCEGLKSNSIHTGAYCKARARLPVEMVSTLLRSTGSSMSNQAPSSWRWRGRPVRLVDGTTVTLPDTPANQEAYPQSRGQKAGLGFPICRLVGIVFLASGAVLDASLGRFRGKGGDEQTLLMRLYFSTFGGLFGVSLAALASHADEIISVFSMMAHCLLSSAADNGSLDSSKNGDTQCSSSSSSPLCWH